MKWSLVLLVVVLLKEVSSRSVSRWSLFRGKLNNKSNTKIASTSRPSIGKSVLVDAGKEYKYSATAKDINHDALKSLLKTIIGSATSKHRYVSFNTEQFIYNVATWPLGWHIYTFHCSQIATTNSLQLHLRSSSTPAAYILIELSVAEQTISLSIKHHTPGISKKHCKLLLKELHSLLKDSIDNNIIVLRKRSVQLRQLSKQAKAVAKSKKNQARDRIIDPDKYRKKSSGNVRRPGGGGRGSGGGSDRYRPSADAQARRTVKSR